MVDYKQLEEYTSRTLSNILGMSPDQLEYILKRTDPNVLDDLYIFCNRTYNTGTVLGKLQDEYKGKCPAIGAASRYLPIADRAGCLNKVALVEAVEKLFEKTGYKLTFTGSEINKVVGNVIRESIERPDWVSRCEEKSKLNDEFSKRVNKVSDAFSFAEMTLLSGASKDPVALIKELKGRTW